MSAASESVVPVSSFRRILPQVLACVAKSLILVDIGLALGFPTTLISALSSSSPDDDDKLRFDKDQSSWFASLIFISQPIGCILSGWLTDRLGRKKAMILVNIPHIAAWLIISYATSVVEMYAAAIILGLGIGIMETPVVTYIGEICQPSIRGILTSTTGVAVTLGYTIVYSLGWMFYWRSVALICFMVPVITIIVIMFVPETPLWLLMRNDVEGAQKSLQWLRGWVSGAAVKTEMGELQRYCAAAKKCKLCRIATECHCEATAAASADRWSRWAASWKRFTASRNLKPFCVVTLFLVFAQMSGFAAMRPYLVPILRNYNVPMDPDQALSIIGLLKLSANLTIMATVKWTGKRRLSLLSSFGVAFCTATLGIYAFCFQVGSSTQSSLGLLPLILVFALAFMTSLGIAPIPWMLLSEVLPIRTRAITSGVTVTINYLVVFGATKTYPMLESMLNMHGVLWLYFSFGAMAFLFLYCFLPETENRTLEEIEEHFATKPMTETYIEKRKEERSVEGVGGESLKVEGGVEERERAELL